MVVPEILRKSKGEERRGVASGAFCTLLLIKQSFCHAKGRSTSLPPNQGISSRIELCSMCLSGLLYVKCKSVQFSTPPRLPPHSAAVFLHTSFPRPSPNMCIGNRAVRVRAGTRLPPKEQQENNSSLYFC